MIPESEEASANLIIGDRQTGKTAIAMMTHYQTQKGKDVICFYVAIGQKASHSRQAFTISLKKRTARWTIRYRLVNGKRRMATRFNTSPPYAGCAMAEYFLYEKHRDVAESYMMISQTRRRLQSQCPLLCSHRPPGREAYPGDVFYLHSRLLERAIKLSDEKGGGSITALPIIETQAGDISAYIPTNVISITDGQIFLGSELFYSGQRPAINVGVSVSRVGGSAQIKAIRKIAGPLRVNLAQYRELAVFAQFGSDLDQSTRDKLLQGERLLETLKQGQYSPYPVEDQVVLLYFAVNGYLLDIPLKEVRKFNHDALDFVKDKYPQVLDSIRHTKELTPDAQDMLKKAVGEVKSSRPRTA